MPFCWVPSIDNKNPSSKNHFEEMHIWHTMLNALDYKHLWHFITPQVILPQHWILYTNYMCIIHNHYQPVRCRKNEYAPCKWNEVWFIPLCSFAFFLKILLIKATRCSITTSDLMEAYFVDMRATDNAVFMSGDGPAHPVMPRRRYTLVCFTPSADTWTFFWYAVLMWSELASLHWVALNEFPHLKRFGKSN